MDKKWTVYVGGVEVNDYLLSFDEAVALQYSYLEQGYDDVNIMEVKEEA